VPARSDRALHLLREHPEEGDLAFRLAHLDEVVEQQLEARLAKKGAVRLCVVATEEHRHAQPLPRPVGAVARAERREEEAVRLEPACDAPEEVGVLFARDVRDRVEGSDPVERSVWKLSSEKSP
jgi:hypothetical protein